MTEFEAATVALQQQQLLAAIAIPVVAGLVGLGQVAVVSVGIWVMDRANKRRDREAESARAEVERREKREDQRHTEAMQALRQQADALRVLIERSAPPPRETP